MQPSPRLPLDGAPNQPDVSVEALCERWRRGEAPLADLLARAGELPILDLVEALASDADERWRQGNRIRVEDYLARYPLVAADSAAACELIYCEFRLRLDRGEAVELTEYMDRFPDFAARLRRKDVQQASYLPGRTTFLPSLVEASSAAAALTRLPADAIPPTSGETGDAVSPPPLLLPGVPDYELHLHIGAGGFGHVWLARNRHDQGLCAVKVVSKGYRIELEGLRVYRQCAGEHPGLVEIRHVGEGEGFYYYVMPLADDVTAGAVTRLPASYEAMTLSRCMPRRVLGLVEILTIARSLLGALVHLQERGVSHCDVKPDNILLVKGQWQLGDVGLATRTERVRPGRGTLAFWPPEGSRDQTADLYALGKTLYLMLTRAGLEHFPEFAAGKLKIAYAGRVEPLRQIILRACQTESARRFASAADMLAAVERAYPDQKRGRRRLIAAALVLAAGVLALSAREMWLHLSPQAEATKPRFVEDLPLEVQRQLSSMGDPVEQWRQNGQFEKELDMRWKHIDIIRRYLGDDHRATEICRSEIARLEKIMQLSPADRNQLAQTYRDDPTVKELFGKDMHDQAIQLQFQNYQTRKRLLGEGDAEAGKTKLYWACLLLAVAKYDQAEKGFHDLEDVFPRVKGPYQEETALVYRKLAAIYEAKGERARAKKHLKESLEIRSEILAPGHELLIYTNLDMFHFLQQDGKGEEAEAHLRAARDQAEKFLEKVEAKLPGKPPISERLTEEAQRLVEASKPEDAQFFRDMATKIKDAWQRVNSSH